MRISWFMALGFLSLLLTIAGCSASATTTGGGGGVTITDLPSSCSADPTVTGCSGSDGYSCTGADAPDENDPTLECSIGVPDATAGTTDYCCLIGETFAAGTCAQDDTVGACTTPDSYGFKCAASDTPDQSDATLTCSTGVADADGTSTDFCCTAGGGTTTVVITGLPASCSADPTVTGCSGSDGYSCTGSDPPDAADPTLECSIGVPDATAGTTDYCCLIGETFAAGTCAQDDTVGDCTTAGSFGFKCAASDTPDQSDATLTCSTGVADADGTSTDFCCTN